MDDQIETANEDEEQVIHRSRILLLCIICTVVETENYIALCQQDSLIENFKLLELATLEWLYIDQIHKGEERDQHQEIDAER